MPPLDALIAELSEFIAIPSVSADPAHQGDVAAAAEWVAERVRRAGGAADVIPWGKRPLVIGEVRASHNADSAPTILCYGHFDVQPPDPLDLWSSPPFDLVDRDGWLYARGIADDKGQLYMLLKAAELLAAAGELPVNLRIACDGEEEIGGHSIVDWVAADERGADAAIVFDSGMIERGVPAFNVAVRGLCYFHVTVRTGTRDLHSGMYGGASLNAMHALMQTLSAVLPRDGRVPEELRVGVVPPSDAEVAGWAALPAGRAEIAAAGSVPADPGAADEFYLRTWGEPSVDVHGVQGGSPVLQKTVIAVSAEANVSIRLVGDQDPAVITDAFETLLREAAPAGSELEITRLSAAPPGLIPSDARAIVLGLDAFEEVLGVRPLLIRSGGAIPLVSALASRGVATVLTGFSLNESNVHSPNERIPTSYLPLGIEAAAALYRHLADLG
ncbi:M20/M25/M40 family metallo-hydrolase [Gaiella sp.]|uniref:M20/M25/M40 family metallo-hydrolase n=1 Tax=Gaiella sp. TaxID=2663207 RepID=UPI003982E066